VSSYRTVKDSTGALQGSKRRVYYRTIEDKTIYELQKAARILQNDSRQNELRTTESGAYITER